jgi:hypothetical protein
VKGGWLSVSDATAPIRSYQRIFKPDRRIYQIDGRRLPVPGGVPLEWLGWAFAALVVVLVLSERSLVLALTLGAVGAVLGASSHGWRGAGILGGCGLVGALAVGVVIGWLDWPLRLIVLPGLVATVAGHPSSDGRATHRFLLSWIAVRMRAARRSLDRPLISDGEGQLWVPQVWVAPDHHSPVLERGRVHGPARLVFGRQVVAIPARRRLIVRPAQEHKMRRGEQLAEVIELGAGQIVEVRP